MQLAIIRDTM